MRTYVYIDGFNFYYGALKGTPYKWLDLEALFSRVLSPRNEIACIKYFTARVQPADHDPGVHVRQDAYLRALQAHCPRIEIIYGHYLRHSVRMPRTRPTPAERTVEVWKTEEKGSDVNMAVHIVHDAWLDAYKCAVVVTNDSDICEALRLVKSHNKKVIGLITPGAPKRKTANQLKQHTDFMREIRESALRQSQLPDPVVVEGGREIRKPDRW